MLIDPTSDLGRLRLRVGDWTDLPLMPDNVYEAVLDECNNNLPRATKLMAQYILALLTQQTHQRLAQIETYGNQWYTQYKDFIMSTILNPRLMQDVPIPYAAGMDVKHPIQQFQEDWNAAYYVGTESQQLHDLASWSSDNGSF